MQQAAFLQCPYCGEQVEVVVDCSVDHQEYVEDCSVCCQPMLLTVSSADDEIVSLEARAENE
jgi:transcription elongation factor Elf1